MTVTREMVRTDPRRAGAVKRWHTWPVLQSQTVAEASWNVARILVQIWPEAPAQAITHALLNDCGEIKSGDLPFPVKRDNPTLKREIIRLEMESMMEQGISHLAAAPADNTWRQRVKICDMIEMWEFGIDERILGNGFAEPIITGTGQSIHDLLDQFNLPQEDHTLVRDYMSRRRART